MAFGTRLLPAGVALMSSPVGSMPTMERLIDALNDAGHLTARVPDLRPFLATKAPFQAVIDAVRSFESAE